MDGVVGTYSSSDNHTVQGSLAPTSMTVAPYPTIASNTPHLLLLLQNAQHHTIKNIHYVLYISSWEQVRVGWMATGRRISYGETDWTCFLTV